MSANAKAVCVVLALCLLLGGAALVLHDAGGGIVLLGFGLLILVGLAFEPRYGRPRSDAVPEGRWQRTGERFVDDESGHLVEVWYDAVSGQRRYVSLNEN